jgi:hypothetical protein
MPDLYTYVSAKVESDEVDKAIESTRETAAEKLGGPDVSLCSYSWSPEYVCTKWMRTVPDIPNPPT